MRIAGGTPISGCHLFYDGGRGPEFGIAAVLLCLMLLAGGGGGYSHQTLMIMLAGVPALVLMWLRGWRVAMSPTSRIGLGVLGLAALTPFLQLIPLPWTIWNSLPGRDLAADVIAAIGREGSWMPVSLTPSATLLAGLSLAPVAALTITTLNCTRSQRVALLGIIAGAAVLSGAIGVLQGAAGSYSTVYYFYHTAHAGTALGIFANRNHHADFLMVGMICGLALIGHRHRTKPLEIHYFVGTGLILFLSVCVVATTSRTGIVLLPLAIAVSLMFLLPRIQPKWLLTIAGGAIFAAVIVVFFGRANSVVQRSLARFEELDDARFEFWQDVLFAAQQYFPVGSGIGSFDVVFRSIENLANVTPRYVNNAHNEYLEILLETGIWGVALLGAFLLCLYARARQTLVQASGPTTFATRASVAAIAILLLHSFVDYPLRTYTLLAVFSVLCGILFAPNESARTSAH